MVEPGSGLIESKDIFVFQEKIILTIYLDEDDNEWFHASTICDALGFSNTAQAVVRNVNEHWYRLDKIMNNKAHYFIAEQGIYQLAFHSKAEFAKKFQIEVFNFLKKLRTGELKVIKPEIFSLQLYNDELELIRDNSELGWRECRIALREAQKELDILRSIYYN